jgi:mono/diheme cytochrome c family protein
MRRSASIIAGLLFVFSTSGANAQADAALDKGRSLLQANCARCHAIGADDQSTHKDAPPFRVVVTRYPPDNLAEALAEGLVSGHPDMPEFVFEPDEVAAITTYLESLKPQSK